MQIGHQGKKILKQMFWALTPLRAIKEMGGFHVSILQEKMWTIDQKLRKNFTRKTATTLLYVKRNGCCS